jgi:serine/threonine protein phosphatase PrpC
MFSQRLGPTQLRITAANAGDARIVIGRKVHGGSTRPLRLTHDHNAQDPTEVLRVEQAGGFVFKNRVMGILAITRSLGDHQLKPFVISHPHVQDTTISVEEDAFIIVACDGLFDVLTDQQAVDLVRIYQRDPPTGKSAAQYLVDESIRRGTTDNVTVMVGFYRR